MQKKAVKEGRALVEKFSHDGRGIARINGKTTFIDGALPEEEVSFIYLKQKKDYDEGKLHQIIQSSTARTVPKCAHYALCGGCSLQHLDDKVQIREKELQLIDLLQRIGHCQPLEVLKPLVAKRWNYRNKARLSVRYVQKKNATLVGFREKYNPRYITDITHCPVLHEKIDTNILSIRRLLDGFVDKTSIAQIEVAAGDDEIALIFRHLNPLTAEDCQSLQRFSEETGLTVYLQPGNAETVKRFYPPATDEFLTYALAEENLSFQFHPTDFTQINPSLNGLMVKRAIDLLELEKEDVVGDLFCGLGNFSLPIAKYCHKVIGIEGSTAMVERASMNAKRNQLHNAYFYCADLTKPAAIQMLVGEGVTKLLLDPPRSGAFEIVGEIEKLNPKRIVYVSCNPATLARDSDILVNHKGYQMTHAGVMDMFPHTAHVESIALFVKDS